LAIHRTLEKMRARSAAGGNLTSLEGIDRLTRGSLCGSCCASDNKRFAAASGVIIVQRWLVAVGCAAMAFQEVKWHHPFSVNGDKPSISGSSIVC
jgi:hypothetical protein